MREIEVPRPVVVEAPAVAPAAPKPALFAGASDDELLGYGVPETWLDDVRGADEDSLLDLADHLPAEAAEALLELATGGTPDRPAHAAADADPFAHPDAQRRFRLVEDADGLERALEFPWEKWTVFLHPAQRRIVENAYSGPTRRIPRRTPGSYTTARDTILVDRVEVDRSIATVADAGWVSGVRSTMPRPAAPVPDGSSGRALPFSGHEFTPWPIRPVLAYVSIPRLQTRATQRCWPQVSTVLEMGRAGGPSPRKF